MSLRGAVLPTAFAAIVGAILAIACGDDSDGRAPGQSGRTAADGVDLPDPEVAPDPERENDEERRHRIVYADRSSHSYLLLVPGENAPTVWTRDELEDVVRRAFGERADQGEVALLTTFVHAEPRDTSLHAEDLAEIDAQLADAALDPDADPKGIDTAKLSRRATDLIATELSLIDLSEDGAPVPTSALADPVLTRDVDAIDSRGPHPLASRRWAIAVRADYRNRLGVRGLRLLQTLVELLARERGAVIVDPDTLESMSVDAFVRRRLSANAGNVADQIAVVPFPDPAREDALRLTTRGMRRFGSPEIEIDALPRDPLRLQRATDLLYGLALVITKDAEVDESGLAVQMDDRVRVRRADVEQAYGSRARDLPPRCSGCPTQVEVHLVRRDVLPDDPRDHPVARVVAPRSSSDASDYDHAEWVDRALADVFGAAVGGDGD